MKIDAKSSKYISKLSPGEHRKNNTLQTSEVYSGNSRMDRYWKINLCKPLYQQSKKKTSYQLIQKSTGQNSIYNHFFKSQKTRNTRELPQPNKRHL